MKEEKKPERNFELRSEKVRSIVGQIPSSLIRSSVRDTFERQEALCRFKSADIKTVENQTVDFQITRTSGNLLQKMLGGI